MQARQMQQMQNLLILNKPLGVRSTRCVDVVRKTLLASGRNVKVGHGGTLDSSASGVLVLLIGRATRLSSLVMQMPKSYEVLVRLGSETSTCDYTGEVTAKGDWSTVTQPDIEGALPPFLGWQMQVPPEISAVHVDGERAHRIARGGGTPEIDARPVFVREIVATSNLSPVGEFTLSISCGKGTYVRSLVRDLGRRLGCGAHVAALKRTATGPFGLDRSFDPSPLLRGDNWNSCVGKLIQAMLPLEEIAAFLPSYTPQEESDDRLERGIALPLAETRRLTFGSFCSDDAACVLSPRVFTVARIGLADGAPELLPTVNVLKI